MKDQCFSNYIQRGLFKTSLCRNIKTYNLLFEQIASDEALDLRVRGNEIDVYYRGGEILRINPTSFQIDSQYFNAGTEEEKSEAKEQISERLKRVVDKPDAYFDYAKKVMDRWFAIHEKQEREDQHHIASNNKSFTDHNNLVVIDIEFAVSYNSYVYNRKYEDEEAEKDGRKITKRYPNPRFDIIAVDKEGQLYVLELKTGIESNDNIAKHVLDFENLVGSDGYEGDSTEMRWKVFAQEMKMVADKLKEHFGYPAEIQVDTTKRPMFMFAYTDKENEDKDKQNDDWKTFQKNVERDGKGIKIVRVDNKNYNLKI